MPPRTNVTTVLNRKHILLDVNITFSKKATPNDCKVKLGK